MAETNPQHDAKAALRARMRSVRDALTPEERDVAGRAITATVLARPEVAGAGVVSLFSSFGSEVSTAHIADGVLSAGKRLLLPFLRDGLMETAEVTAGEALVATAYGPLEPAQPVPVDPVMVDVVIAPGLGFDPRGNRLGYGKGHYDGYLRRIRPEVPRIGIAYAAQIVNEVPAGERDERMDMVVTEAGVVVCAPPRALPG